MTRRVKLVIAYKGTNFRGLASNVGVRTVVGELERVLDPVLGHPPVFAMSGRTDAGVHAAMQVLSFDTGSSQTCQRIQKTINSRLAPEVVALEVSDTDSDFHARFSATGRRYVYTVLNRPTPDPFCSETAWWVNDPLQLDLLRLACDPLIGTHDFASFCRKPKPISGVETEPSTVRRVDKARWADAGDGFLRFEISGSAFCHQMVRSIVGLHVAIGAGKRTAGEVRQILAARDRNASVSPAPPHGLSLVEVMYELA